MDVSYLLDGLNDAQREAVTTDAQQLLVLAGAGSGKTRVLVHRIAWQIAVNNISPGKVLAVTFTNKAAAEMRHRIESLINMPTQGMWVGTFHGLAHRLLRSHYQAANLPENFQILDSDDQQRLLKRIIKGLDLSEDQWPAKQAQWFINGQKDEGKRAKDISGSDDLYLHTMREIYTRYEETCQQGGLVDFAELLLRAYELWQNNSDILTHYQNRFASVLIDEFQDTNSLQYNWLKQLITPSTYLMAVGDDDQSIYGWRGAKIENIQLFSHDFPQAQTVRLEQNYRSTQTILTAANQLIDHNQGRLGKTLWSDGDKGEAISLYMAFNEIEEARYVADNINSLLEEGRSAQSIAILYRSNAQSRVLEEALLQSSIPYRIYGGLRFFERAEIRDALAYLRLVGNRHDDAAYERVVNTPTRGIGEQTLMQIRQHAREYQLSMWQASLAMINEQMLTSRACSSVARFLELINQMAEDTVDVTLHETCEHVIQHSGLLDHFRKERGEKGQARIENLQELVSACKEFVPDEGEHPLQAFLSHAALEAGEHQADNFTDCVQMMTLHTAKGLEFPVVFISGMEEGLFPHKMALEESGRLEEERRLCYVGMTRAMEHLTFTLTEKRRLYGRESYQQPSRFLKEMPSKCLHEVRMRQQVSRPSNYGHAALKQRETDAPQGLRIGQTVNHPKFGLGIVVQSAGRGADAQVQVSFHDGGTKWLVASLAKLEAV